MGKSTEMIRQIFTFVFVLALIALPGLAQDQPPTSTSALPTFVIQSPEAAGSPPSPPAPSSRISAPDPGQPPNVLDANQLAEFRTRQQALAARQQKLLDARAPADAALLAARAAVPDAAADESERSKLEWERSALEWYTREMTKRPSPGTLELPGVPVLDIALVGTKLELSFEDTHDGTTRTYPPGTVMLQVARVGRPVNVVIWLSGPGYRLIPQDYVEPYFERPLGTEILETAQ